ncbi:MAG: hypothetical protein IT293_05470 [Deltaproteobacteria bacterium]|nr:hypothetical protein [Deltaproteobacteria bacterium]
MRAAKAAFTSCADTADNPAVCFAIMRASRDACTAAVGACRARCPACAADATSGFTGCATAPDLAECAANVADGFQQCLRSSVSGCEGYEGLASAAALALSPYPVAEAEQLALEASGAFVAAPDVYTRIRDDLAAIRSAYPEVRGIEAFESWRANELLVSFDDAGKAMVDAGTYDAWACQNTRYGLTSISPSIPSFYVLEFSHRMNAPLLASEYAGLSHVTSAEPNSIFGDHSDVCAAIAGTTYTYVFDEGSGDCPSGCIDHTYWGFATTSTGSITSLGTWSRGDSPPPWFVASGCVRWL